MGSCQRVLSAALQQRFPLEQAKAISFLPQVCASGWSMVLSSQVMFWGGRERIKLLSPVSAQAKS